MDNRDGVACSVEDLEVRYSNNGPPVVRGVSFKASLGEVVLLAGPNGGGKTTIIKSIVGLVKPSRGRVVVLGRNPLTDVSVRRLIGYVPQVSEFNLLAPLTVWDLVSLGRYPRLGLFRRMSKEDEDLLINSIRAVGLEKHMDKTLSELSGGELSRAMIAKALAQDPLIYLLDEPFESIDVSSERAIIRVLLVEKKKGKLVVVTEHHISDVDWVDKAVVVDKRVLAEGPPRAVLNKVPHNRG